MKRSRLLVFILCLLPLILSVNSHFNLSNDAATYSVLAKNLAEGRGYTYQGYPHIKYPPGFPALLSLVILFFGPGFLYQRIFMALTGAFSLWMGYVWAKRRFGENAALPVLIAMGFTMFFVYYASFTLTDVPFLGLIMLGMILLKNMERRPGYRKAFFSGLVFGLGSMFRLAGLLVVPALLVSFLARMKRTRCSFRHIIVTVIVACLPCLAWFSAKAMTRKRLPVSIREGATYLSEMKGESLWLDTPKGIFPNMLYQLRIRPVIFAGACAQFLTGGRAGKAGVEGPWGQKGIVSIICAGVILVSALYSLLKGFFPMDVFFFIYLAILMVTPPFVGWRYFVPLLPFLYGSIFHLSGSLAGRFGSRYHRLVPLFLGLVFLGLWAGPTIDFIKKQRSVNPYKGHELPFVRTIMFLKEKGAKGSTTICAEGPIVHLLSGKRAWGFPLTNEKDVKEWIMEKADYVLLSSWSFPVDERLLRKAVYDLLLKGVFQLWHEEKGTKAIDGTVPWSALLKRIKRRRKW